MTTIIAQVVFFGGYALKYFYPLPLLDLIVAVAALIIALVLIFQPRT